MARLFTTLFVISGLFLSAKSQQLVSWSTLSKVRYEQGYNSFLKAFIDEPVYDTKIEQLHKKEVLVQGFIVPLGAFNDRWAISVNPNSSCFFCGGSGPESVIELKFNGKAPDLKIDDFVVIEGTFILERDPMELMYRVESASLIQ